MKKKNNVLKLVAVFVVVLTLLTSCAQAGTRVSESSLSAVAVENADSFGGALSDWQIKLAAENGASRLAEDIVENSVNLLRSGEDDFNAPIPAQSAEDEAFLDALHYKLQDYFLLRGEMAVLTTLQRDGVNYSLVVTAGVEGRSMVFAVSWRQEKDTVDILEWYNTEWPRSFAILPAVADLSGQTVFFSLLQSKNFDGETSSRVECGTLEINLSDGNSVVQDVSGQPGVLVLLPQKSVGYTLRNTSGEVLCSGDLE